MFKAKTSKRKNAAEGTHSTFVPEVSNFKSGSIKISGKQTYFSSLRNIDQLGGIPNKNEGFRIVTRKNINSFDFVLAILAHQSIEHLTIAIYRIGKKVLTEIKEIQKSGKIGKVTLLVNDGFPRLCKDAWSIMKSLEGNNFEIKIENNHTKIILMKTLGGFYVVEGSGNLSINARIEQYAFDNNERLYNFHKTWIKAI